MFEGAGSTPLQTASRAPAVPSATSPARSPRLCGEWRVSAAGRRVCNFRHRVGAEPRVHLAPRAALRRLRWCRPARPSPRSISIPTPSMPSTSSTVRGGERETSAADATTRPPSSNWSPATTMKARPVEAELRARSLAQTTDHVTACPLEIERAPEHTDPFAICVSSRCPLCFIVCRQAVGRIVHRPGVYGRIVSHSRLNIRFLLPPINRIFDRSSEPITTSSCGFGLPTARRRFVLVALTHRCRHDGVTSSHRVLERATPSRSTSSLACCARKIALDLFRAPRSKRSRRERRRGWHHHHFPTRASMHLESANTLCRVGERRRTARHAVSHNPSRVSPATGSRAAAREHGFFRRRVTPSPDASCRGVGRRQPRRRRAGRRHHRCPTTSRRGRFAEGTQAALLVRTRRARVPASASWPQVALANIARPPLGFASAPNPQHASKLRNIRQL